MYHLSFIRCIRRTLALTTLLLIDSAASASGTLNVKILGADGTALPARAWVDARGERFFEPTAPDDCTPYRRDKSFSCNGEFTIELPPGKAVVHIERGKEWLPIDREIDVTEGVKTQIEITLKRWIDLPAEGFYSTDMHVHFGYDRLAVLKQLALADDLHVLPAFSYWLRGTEDEWNPTWPAWPEGEPVSADDTHFVTRSNLEIERISQRERPGGSIGASFLFNLNQPVTTDRFDPRFPTDTTLCLLAKEASPNCIIDTDKPSWAETVIGAALGVYDTAQVCHNHYHRSQTLPGGWGMVGPLEQGEGDLAQGDELFHRTNRQYYSWLNCGIRMGVSGGSAIGVMAVPAGYNRVYAKVEGELTVTKFWKSIQAGNTFATSGPILTLKVNGQPLGSTVECTSGTPLNLSAHLRSIDPIEKVEIIRNGKVLQSIDLARHRPAPAIDEKFNWWSVVTRSGWFAARALYRAPDGRLRQAHTSPIYAIVNQKPIAFKADAEYMIGWVDQLTEIAKLPDRYRSTADRDQVLSVYQQARKFYRAIVETAANEWND